MNKTRLSVMLILLLLAGLVLAKGAAGQEPAEVFISPWLDGFTYNIDSDQIGVLRAGWLACSQGLVNAWIAASNYEVSLNSEVILTPEDVDALWGPIEFSKDPEWEEYCVGKSRLAVAYWHYLLDELGPGEYIMESSIWIDHTLIDGGDLDEDGRPDIYRPEEYRFDTVNTIIVHSDP